jgi:hypothetical protein
MIPLQFQFPVPAMVSECPADAPKPNRTADPIVAVLDELFVKVCAVTEPEPKVSVPRLPIVYDGDVLQAHAGSRRRLAQRHCTGLICSHVNEKSVCAADGGPPADRQITADLAVKARDIRGARE